MRPLIIDDQVRAAVAEVVKFAESNWYRIGQSETIPGDDPRHTVILWFGYRCVFSFTHSSTEKRTFRHLTISVPGKDYPNEFAVFAIANLFGFTGYNGKSAEPPSEWLCNVNKEEHCVVVLQEVGAL
jgi:hypothetical protein